jgi:hypothetical protein
MRIQSVDKSDFVRDFTENPYFERPQTLASGRVRPDVAQAWRVEDEIENSKGTGKWTSVAERIARRHSSGSKSFKKQVSSSSTGEELSYLTVSCDFQEIDKILPHRVQERSRERGFYYAVAQTHVPIEGPMTKEEFADCLECECRTTKHLASYVPFKLASNKVITWDRWSPRELEVKHDSARHAKVTVNLDDTGEIVEWSLRKGVEWPDFKFLVNSKLGRDDWEAYTEGYIWDGKVHGQVDLEGTVINGSVNRPRNGQSIGVRSKVFSKEESEARVAVFDKILDGRPEAINWELEEEQGENAKNLDIAPNLSEEDPYVIVELPNLYLVAVQIMKGNEWAYFSAFMDTHLGENAWIAVFEQRGELIPWFGSSIIPKNDQLVVVRRLKEETPFGGHFSILDLPPLRRHSNWAEAFFEAPWKRQVARPPPPPSETERAAGIVPLEVNPQLSTPQKGEMSFEETSSVCWGEMEFDNLGNPITS